MKSKKEYVLLFIVIMAVSLYLVFRNTDKIQYQLPDIPKIAKNEITKIEIIKPDASISLLKRDNAWLIGPEEYPAANSINSMIDVISGLTVTGLVAEAKNDPRYDLTEEKKIAIKAWAKDSLKLEFEVGKTAPSQHHTFIKLSNDPRIYLADGNFRGKFNKSVDDLRDKTILTFEKDEIQEIEIMKGNQSVVLAKKELPMAPPNQVAETEVAAEITPQTSFEWENSEGQKADESFLESMLGTLSNLKCQNFIDDQEKSRFTAPIYTIKIKGTQSYTLSLFEKTDDNDKAYPAISSENNDPFLLSESQVKGIMKDPEEVLKKEE